MSTNLIEWECPNCQEQNEDFIGETYCSCCGEVVYVFEDGSVDDMNYKVEIKWT